MEHLEIILFIIGTIIIPLVIFSFKQNTRVSVLEVELRHIKEYKELLDKIFDKLEKLQSEIHQLNVEKK